MKKTISLLLCACLLFGLTTMASARFTNIGSYGCAAPLKGNVITAEGWMELRNVVSGSKIEITVQELGSTSKQTYSGPATTDFTIFTKQITVKSNTVYIVTFKFIAGVDTVSEEFTVVT